VFGTNYRPALSHETDVADEFRALTVADLMAVPVTLPATATLRDAAILLAKSGAAVVPVVSADGAYVGAFGEADIHRLLSEGTHGFHSPDEFRTGVPFLGARLPDAMWKAFARVGLASVRSVARTIAVVSPSDRVFAAVEAMRRQRLGAVPVVVDDRPVGILHADALTLRLLEHALAFGR